MFPLKALPNAKRTPHITRLIALACVLVFALQLVYQFTSGGDLASVYGVHPRCLWQASACSVLGDRDNYSASWMSIFYGMFLHADVLHVAFNVWFLLVFGGALEDQLGRWRFLFCYFFGGLVAALTHSLVHPLSTETAIGASGAIAAVLGAYLVRLPKSWVLTYIPPIFVFPVPAPLFLVIWFAMQFLGVLNALSHTFSSHSGNSIAWFAHLGGFAFGAYYGWRTLPRRGGQRKATSGSVAA